MAREILPTDCAVSRDEVARIIRGNLVDEFERLRAVPGYQLDPVSWEEMKSLVAENTAESLGKLGRAPSGSVVYWRFKDKIEKEYASVADYMQKTVFEFDTELTADGKKRVIVPAPDHHNPTVVWRPNDFPYNFEEGMEHHNIWSTVPLPEARVLQVIEEHRKGYEFVWFTNPFPLASIPTVWHAHIISRPLTNGLSAGRAVYANAH